MHATLKGFLSSIYLPVETFGGWHDEAEKQIERIGREFARSTSGSDQNTSTNHLFQRQPYAPEGKCRYNSELIH